MRAWDSVTLGGSLRPGPAAFAILLAGLLLSLAPVSQRIEAAYYDLLQGLQAQSGSSRIVLIDTSQLSRSSGTVWEAAGFPDLLTALGRAGASLVIPVEAPPLTSILPDSGQLAALAEIERRSRKEAGDGPAPGRSASIDAFAKQVDDMRRRSELHSRTVQAAAFLRSLIVAVPTFDGGRGADVPATNCLKHTFNTEPANHGIDASALRRVQAIAAPPESLCDVLLGAGHVEFWPDEDGVVRRSELLLNASGTLVPSAALRAAIAVSVPSGRPPTVTRESIARVLGTTGGAAALIRFYGARNAHPAFEIIKAEELIHSNAAAKRIAGRIVILGNTSANGQSGYATPIEAHIAPATLLATGLSNLLQDDYLVRPAWLAWLENVMLILVGISVLVWGASIAPGLAVMAGVVFAACFLVVEAFLVVRTGVWAQFATAAAFTIFSLTAIRFLQPRQEPATPLQPALAPAGAGPQVPAAARVTGDDELDLAFSMLRHQPPSEHVKKRLYDVALEHARRRDLAKAERVLRHLASLDPDYRHAGEKLKKLAGLRNAAPQPAERPTADQPMRPILQPMVEPESLIGQTIGRYQIEQPIGRGAMATVYLGRDPKINRRVAIKTIALAEEFSDTDLANARTQFLREAESAGRLNHPNIISIYDAGEDGQVAYLAMEYFPGKSLSYYAQQGQLLPPRRVLELMARAAEALHYAHGQHVVHRDVKPANLLYDTENDTLKITDFGIARLTDTSRTKTGIILGTPSYMSPEQLAGTNVTGQTDLFSLGITLYQLLTGIAPFRADSIPRLMQKIAHERHEPVKELRNDLPPCVDEILERALAKDAGERFASGRAMALALRDCCSSFEVSTPVQP